MIFARAEPGLLTFVDSILTLLGIADPMLIQVSDAAAPEGLKARLKQIPSDPHSPKTLHRVAQLVGAAEATLVLYAVDRSPKLAAEQLADYARFVGHRCYLVALRTARGQPWIGYARLRAQRALHDLVRADAGLVIDGSWDRNVLSSCPSGFVLRVGDRAASYDESLDLIAEPAG